MTGLTELLLSKALVLRGNRFVEEDLDKIRVGEIILVKPGDMVPTDGVIVEGTSGFDTSYVIGEPEPRVLGRGDYVVRGFYNIDKMVKVKVLKRPRDSMLQLLVKEAEKALKRKARIQKLIEKISKPYTFIILALFFLTSMFIEPYNALAILLVGCPSAFIVLSATSTTLSIAMLARNSIIVRGA